MVSWNPDSWRTRPIVQQPEWPDPAARDSVLRQLQGLPPLIFAGEAQRLREALGRVAQGRGFLLQAGDCAETFDAFSEEGIRDKLKVILQMAVVLTYGAGLPVVKVGRIAGQFAKPRSALTEVRGGEGLPVYRGDIVNGLAFTADERRPDPARMLRAYHQASATLNLLRALSQGGFADLVRVQAWNQAFVARSPAGQRYQAMAQEVERALRFMAACGVNLSSESELHRIDFYVSHEALLLDFEEAMVRQDPSSGRFYDTSAHLLWIGERTRQPNGAHVEFMRGIGNPVGLKLGPSVTPDEAVALCGLLDPQRQPGRLTLISRMGAAKIEAALPGMVRAVRDAGHPVVWACDPMHGNTITGSAGHKTRRFDDILSEVRGFFAVHRDEGTHPGGLHVELTGEDVTECLGGAEEILEEHLGQRYETACDPRLNASQSLEMAYRVSEMLRS
ncbi:MAG TPA: 3-deoxy-7-phosphoheptulonate synthase class II [Myxococcaceae bacterium]|nr:3-deoxy-7-phosphoheptulonate synthase class II [Myxococcaceae bacterium]